MVDQCGAHDSLFSKEDLREADPKSVMQMLPESSDQNESCSDPTPSIYPAVCEAIGQDSLTVIETSGERNAMGEKTINVPNSSLKDAAKSTRGKSTGSARKGRDWGWEYCSTLEGNSNGVRCSFCDLEIKGGGITRFKSHISENDPSKNVKKCEKVPPEVKAEIDQKRIKRR